MGEGRLLDKGETKVQEFRRVELTLMGNISDKPHDVITKVEHVTAQLFMRHHVIVIRTYHIYYNLYSIVLLVCTFSSY